jgi:hypothetical protein
VTEPLAQVIPADPANPHPLGRHVNHDPRSRAFPFAARPEAEAPVVSRPAWTRRIGVLDQGSTGSCTGHAGAGWVGADTADRTGVTRIGDVPLTTRAGDPLPPIGPVDEGFAVALYSAATQIDPYSGAFPPDDTGSDGLSVAKVLRAWGLCAEYTHALGGLPDVLAGLQSGPVLLGTRWYSSMFRPAADGELVVTPDAHVSGGHENGADGELDVERRRVWVTNSWGAGWGVAGRAWMSYDTLAGLLAEEGDATVLHASAVIAPEPRPFPVWLPADAAARVVALAARRRPPVSPERWISDLVTHTVRRRR